VSQREGVGDDLLRRIDDGVCWITLNRPDAGNAMTTPMRDQIGDWMIEASADPWVRAVVLTGTGEKGFCTGADIRSQRRDPPPKPEGAPERIVGDAARIIRTGWGRLVTSIMDCEKPVIAGVNGTAAGGGMHLALACDLVVMAEEAKLISVFVRRGIAPDAGGAYILTRLVGLQKAKELFFFGDDIPAAEAHRIGLANKVVPRADLEKTPIARPRNPPNIAPTMPSSAVMTKPPGSLPGIKSLAMTPTIRPKIIHPSNPNMSRNIARQVPRAVFIQRETAYNKSTGRLADDL
jgi:2-(1,2-epoxy-1,2-dihydrophenyl)acetyl-CoA isomerase